MFTIFDVQISFINKMDNNQFDDALFAILKECKTLPNFLDVVFGFLKRRTDFYYISPDRNSQVGLPEGMAEYVVKQSFMKFKNAPLNEESVEITSVDKPESSSVQKLPQEPSDAFTSSESYNGRVFETYSWSQTIKEVDVIVKLPENATGKNIKVTIRPQSIQIYNSDTKQMILEGDLYQKIKSNDALWSLDKRKLEIHLEKSSEMWWNCFFQNESKLDVSKIDCSRPFDELPEEAQAKIEELTWNQERKRMGLPTSEELFLQEKLKKAWNVEGSPFKGPFDPNSIIIKND